MKKNEDDLIEEFIDDCKQRLSHHSVKSITSTLTSFKSFLGDVNICYASKIDVRRFLNDLKNRKRSRSTITSRLSSLKSFYKYLKTYYNMETIDLDDVDIMDYPKSRYEGFGTDPLTRKEVRALIEAPDNLRDALILSFLYYCGFRADEITKIKIEDINREHRVIGIIGKGDKPRTVPYIKHLDRLVNRWLKRERRSYVFLDSPYVFPSKHGERLSTKAIREIVHKNAIKAGIQQVIGKRADGSNIYKVHTHVLRHTYANHAVKNHVPLPLVQKMMGHNQITTTMQYAGDVASFDDYYKKFKEI